MDDSVTELTYGESDLDFFLRVVDTALGAAGGDANGFCDLGGGKGQLALAAARAEPERLGGRCVSLELVPELHRIGAAAMVAAALSRTEAVRGDIYDLDTLSACIGGARGSYC